MRSRRAGAASALAVAAVAMLAASCGGGDSGVQSWADDVCTEVNTWADRVTDAVQGVVAQGFDVSAEQVRLGVDEAANATDDLVTGLRDLGRPDTESGDQAREQLDQLASDLEERRDRARKLLERPSSVSGTLQLVQAVAGEIEGATGDVRETLNDLEQVQPGDELRDAFQNSEPCQQLRDRDFSLGG
jgi:hypothetical protein